MPRYYWYVLQLHFDFLRVSLAALCKALGLTPPGLTTFRPGYAPLSDYCDAYLTHDSVRCHMHSVSPLWAAFIAELIL